MKRFITYLYVYENGIKKRNVGFARVRCLDTVKRMEISIRNLGRYSGKAEVFTLVEGKTGVEGIPVDTIIVSRGFGNASFEFSDDDVIGIRIELEEPFFVASCWREDKADAVIGKFSVRVDEDEEKTAEKKVQGESDKEISAMEYSKIPVTMNEMLSHINYRWEDADEILNHKNYGQEATNEIRDKEKVRDKDEVRDKEKVRDKDEAREKDEVRDKNEVRDQDEARDKNAERDRIKNKKEIDDIKYKEISLEDLKKLPRKNWYLCNNSFLLYGFYCYKYLIIKSVLTEHGEKFYVGVPGVFLEPEKIVAQLFGFDEFEPDNTKKPQDEPEGRFGYWLCEIDMAL